MNSCIETLKDNDDTMWFRAIDVAKLLGYRHTRNAISRHVNDDDKCRMKDIIETHDKYDSNINRTIYINKSGCCALLTKCRLIIPEDILIFFRKYDIYITRHIRYECKETETLGYIMKSYKNLNMITQKKVGNYVLDMYIPTYRIWIECDENDHNDRDNKKEKDREEYIKRKIKGVNLIRYNPDEENFNIFDVISRINECIIDKHISFDEYWCQMAETTDDDSNED